MSDSKGEIIIVGGGLVGSLCACYLAKRNYDVHLYEKRKDIRKNITDTGKSINLALSNRARKALRAVGLEKDVLANSVPLQGRYIHDLAGNNYFLPYDVIHKQNLYSVNRNVLNGLLLTASEEIFNVKTYFEHELEEVDLKSGTVRLKNLRNQETIVKKGCLIVGADGAHSTLRDYMQKQNGFSITQKYIDHGYVELNIPPNNGKVLRPDAFHIWPRRTFILIAMPNSNGTFTVTLFMPFSIFDELKRSKLYLEFFEQNFPDAIDLLGVEQISQELPLKNPGHLVSIFCHSYNFENKAILMGDAAHAMVPFYGQGINAGFEDCRILNDLLNLYEDEIGKAIQEFTNTRKEDAHTICKLAMYNYKEMSNLVMNKSFRLRKVIDEFIYALIPTIWVPLYVSVTFTDIKYKTCLENKMWQDQIIKRALLMFALAAVLCSWLAYYWTRST